MSLLDRILGRRKHYRATFKTMSGDAVMADLRRFCRAGEPALILDKEGRTDVYATGMLAGRQEVFWRIASHLELDDAQLLKLKETAEYDN